MNLGTSATAKDADATSIVPMKSWKGTASAVPMSAPLSPRFSA